MWHEAKDLSADQKAELFTKMLRGLKRGAGLTPERAGGATLWYTGSLGARTANASYELLRGVLDSMNQNHDYVKALQNAYGGEGLDDDLNVRRELFAAQHKITLSRVKDLEEIGIQELYQLLMSTREIEPMTSDAEDSSIKELLLSLTEAVKEQTVVLREISAKLDRMS